MPSTLNNVSNTSTTKISEIPQGKYKWNKRNYCIYCGTSIIKLARHLKDRHPHEKEVAEILKCKEESVKRNLLRKLLREGNFIHNKKMLSNNSGYIMPQMRPNKVSKSDASDYLPCIHCKGFFISLKNSLGLVHVIKNTWGLSAWEHDFNIMGTSVFKIVFLFIGTWYPRGGYHLCKTN